MSSCALGFGSGHLHRAAISQRHLRPATKRSDQLLLLGEQLLVQSQKLGSVGAFQSRARHVKALTIVNDAFERVHVRRPVRKGSLSRKDGLDDILCAPRIWDVRSRARLVENKPPHDLGWVEHGKVAIDT